MHFQKAFPIMGALACLLSLHLLGIWHAQTVFRVAPEQARLDVDRLFWSLRNEKPFPILLFPETLARILNLDQSASQIQFKNERDLLPLETWRRDRHIGRSLSRIVLTQCLQDHPRTS